MDEKTAEQVGVFLKMVNESLQSGKDFVLEQAPLVVQEMVAFGRAYHTSVFALGVLLIVLTLAAYWIIWKVCRSFDDPDFMRGMAAAICGGPVFLGVLVSCAAFEPMLQAWVAPRLYVLEEVARMLK